MITAASTAAWTAGPASRMPWLCPWILWCRGLAKEGRIRRIWWLAAVHATPSRVPASTPTSRRPKNTCSRTAKSCAKHGNPRRRGRLPGPQGRRTTAIRSAAWCPWSTCRNSSLLVRLSCHPTVVGGGPALLCPEASLSRPRFISPPFLRRNKAHARAVAFVVARSLAGILERRVAAGAMPARAHLSCKLRRTSRWTAAYADPRFCVL